jgi:hypothetical protein
MNSLPSFLLRPQICPRVSLSFPQVYLVTQKKNSAEFSNLKYFYYLSFSGFLDS